MKKRRDVLNFLVRNEYKVDFGKIEKYCDIIDKNYFEPEYAYDAIYEVLSQISLFDTDVMELFEHIANGAEIIDNDLYTIKEYLSKKYQREIDVEEIDEILEEEECYQTQHYIIF